MLLHDPYVSEADAAELGVRPVGLAELFAQSDVVSVHTPLLPATLGLVSRELLMSMRPDGVLINTSRGAVVDQDALTDVLRQNRIRAILDVTDPDTLPSSHPLWECDNALITPISRARRATSGGGWSTWRSARSTAGPRATASPTPYDAKGWHSSHDLSS